MACKGSRPLGDVWTGGHALVWACKGSRPLGDVWTGGRALVWACKGSRPLGDVWTAPVCECSARIGDAAGDRRERHA